MPAAPAPETTAADPRTAPADDLTHSLDTALALLADGVPLSLLLDLAGAVPSRTLYREEAGDARWLRTA